MSDPPALSGNQLIKLLTKDGWESTGRRTHGMGLKKRVEGVWRVTVVPMKNRPLTPSLLAAILGPKQTTLGRKGLQRLIDAYGAP